MAAHMAPGGAQGAGGFTLKGWHVLAMILAFFGTVITVNGVFITAAVQSFPGEDVPRSYVQGLQYNETLADRRAQAALGWRASADLIETPAGAALEVRLVDRAGRGLPGAAWEGVLRRPVADGADIALALEPMGDGRYQALLADLAPGQWELRARARLGEDAFDITGRLIWRSSTPP